VPVIGIRHTDDELDAMAKASPQEIVQRCGKPTNQWVTRAGKGKRPSASEKYLVETTHIWYSGVPIELQTTRFPNDPNPKMHQWTFNGGFMSIDPDDDRQYANTNLASVMPCTAQWAAALVEVGEKL
jgi:hypothetical protein